MLKAHFRVSNHLFDKYGLTLDTPVPIDFLEKHLPFSQAEKTQVHNSGMICTILKSKVEPSDDLYHINLSKQDQETVPEKFETDKYKLLVEAANDVIYEIDLNGRFTYVNPKAVEVSGYSEEECIGMVYLELVRPDWRNKVLQFFIRQIDESVKSTYLEFPVITKDGQEKWIGQSTQLLEDEVAVTGAVAIARDITENYRSQKALQQSEEKYRGIIQNLQYGLMEVDLNERIIYANEAMCIITGYSQDELIGQIASELLVDKDSQKVIKSEHEKRGQGVASVYQIKLKHKDGSPIYSLISGAPIYDVDGNRTGSIGIHMDITKKQKDEEALREARNQLAKQNKQLKTNQKYLNVINGFVTKLLDNETLHDIAWEIAENVINEFGFEDCVIYILDESKAVLEQLAAYGAKTTESRTVLDPIGIQLGKGIVGTVAQTGKAEIINNTTLDSRYIVDDEPRLSEIAVPIVADGEVIGVIDSEHPQKGYFQKSHLETLTTIANLAANRLKNGLAKQRQLKAEQELRDSEIKLRKILDSAIDAVISIDHKGIIMEWNRQAEVIFGFSMQEVIGKTLTETIIPVNFREAHDKGMKHYLKTGEGPVLNQKIEISALRKSGEEFPIELAIIPVKTKGVQTFTAFVSDITIQKQVRDETEKALSKERELNELKSRFVAMTSHEFRTPLTTIKQNTDLISYQIENSFPDHLASFTKYLERIESEIGRVTSLMNDILMLGRIESGKMEIKKKPIDLVEFCEKMAAAMDQESSINFKVQGVPRPVSIDIQLFDHVISNLLSNALKYSEGKPSPEMILAFNDIDKVRVHVKDYGIGIPKKDQKGLFQSFYRATNVKNIQGSGLGLSIVKEFTEMHGGQVHLESEANKGAEFIVEIPYN